MSYANSSRVIKKDSCPKCVKEGRDKDQNNAIHYEDGGIYCWAGHGILKLSETFKKENGIDEVYREPLNMGPFDDEMWQRLKDTTSNRSNNFRGISEETATKYGVRHKFDEETGDVTHQYYPITTNGKLSGVKWRDMNKDFFNRGEVGSDADLFGQAIFKNSTSTTIVIACGEVDALSAYEMLAQQSIAKGFEPCPVVTSTVGEGGIRQYQKQYDFLNRFQKIIICPDRDKAGEAALHKLAQVLPKDKIFVMDLPLKDANDMLTKGREKEFVNRFFKARSYSPSGIVGSDTLYDAVLDSLDIEKLTFPPFMQSIQSMLRGGLKVPSIMNIVAPSGIGKSTIVNEMVYYWILNSTYKIGILSLEADSSDYGAVLASRHLGRKLSLIEDPLEAKAYLMREDIREKLNQLFRNEDGTPRFWLMEERDGKLDKIKELIEKLIIACGCKVIVIDPLQDLFAGMSNDEQENFVAWLKMMIKAYGVIFICINHIRKQDSKTDQNKMYNESEIMGSSTIIKSSFFTVLLNRNKYLDQNDPNVNRISVMISKNRQTGITGPANDLYYDNETHTLYDFEEYRIAYPEKFENIPSEDKEY